MEYDDEFLKKNSTRRNANINGELIYDSIGGILQYISFVIFYNK
jgi:hypothetical protein